MPRAAKVKSSVPAKKPSGAKRNKLYSMPEKIAEGTVLTDLSKTQWRVGPSIGIGGFGEIYSACRVGEKNYEYVVKCEPHGNGPLFVEMHFYMRNAKLEDIKNFRRERGLKSLGMPYMVGNGSADIKGQKHRFIVMPRYGSDVTKHFLANGRRLPEGTVYRLALQMLDVYEYIHECGYIHADLKAANILLGYGKSGGAQAYLVDYGLASHYTTKEFKPDPRKMHNGTIEYTSRDAHLGVPTMRADLEILGYNLIEWLGVQLPWVRDNLLSTPAKVQKAKDDFMGDIPTQLKKIFPNGVPVAIVNYMKYVAKMKYDETPDYDKCREMFANALKTLRISNTGDLDFKITGTTNNNPTHSKQRKIVATPDTSSDIICASDDDDIVFEQKPAVKTAPQKPLKMANDVVATARDSPQRKVLKRTPVKRTPPSPARRMPIHNSPRSPLRSPTKKTKSRISPRTKEQQTKTTRISPAQRKQRIEVDVSNSTPSSSTTPKTSSSLLTSGTPIKAKANINVRPGISINTNSAGRTRQGKTVINDQLTPNVQAGKTYEFNFELDVSVDANVIVNVKRKKKAPTSTIATSSHSSLKDKTNDDDTPVTRVKVRKVADGDDALSSPIVTVKKTKRNAAVSPRVK